MKLKAHDEQAMIILYKSYWKELYISAFKVLKDKETCEDIIQELFITIWNKREELAITSSLRNYLLASVRYEVYRKIRGSKKYGSIMADLIETVADHSLYDVLEYKELQGRIANVIDSLPTKCREVYHLSRNEHLSHKEISARLSISTKTVRNHLTKALHFLRISMDQILLFLLLIFF
jgi:RNA polymerase sigma-70 factor (ECF subfamily)